MSNHPHRGRKKPNRAAAKPPAPQAAPPVRPEVVNQRIKHLHEDMRNEKRLPWVWKLAPKVKWFVLALALLTTGIDVPGTIKYAIVLGILGTSLVLLLVFGIRWSPHNTRKRTGMIFLGLICGVVTLGGSLVLFFS